MPPIILNNICNFSLLKINTHLFGEELLDWLAMGAIHIILMPIFVFTPFPVNVGGKIWKLSVRVYQFLVTVSILE